MKIKIPADVKKVDDYIKNYQKATHNSGKLMLFAGDQKIEHLNKDFYGNNIAPDDSQPEHLFKIASEANIGVFATQLGLISRYFYDYPEIPYLVKMNSKTNLVKFEQRDPISTSLFDFEKVINFKEKNKANILGVGYTIYLGSEFEHIMLNEGANLCYEAHQEGLIVVFWMYPKGKSVIDENDPDIVAGAAGVAACLGADFAKVKVPKKEGQSSAELLKIASKAAGNTGIVCEGGSKKHPLDFLKELYEYINIGNARGNGTGRNIHQRPLKEAIAFANAIFNVTVNNKTPEEAYRLYLDEIR